jgi:type II secretory pathway component GspD/PulD (secretin)
MKTSFLALGLLLVTTANAQISFNYKNVKASDVVYSISKLTKTTIVAPEINTQISLQANDVSKKEALHILQAQLNVMKYVMMKEDDIYVVRQLGKNYQDNPNPSIINQVLVLRVFQLRSADAKNIARVITDVTVNTVNQRNQALLNDFIQNNTRDKVVYGEVTPVVTYDDYSNCLIARGTQAQIDEIEKLLTVLDGKRNIVWTTKVYHLKYAVAADLAPILTNAFTFIVNGQYQSSVSSYASGNALIVTCPQNYSMDFDNLITCLDARAVPQDNVHVFKLWNGNTITISSLLNQIGGKKK